MTPPLALKPLSFNSLRFSLALFLLFWGGLTKAQTDRLLAAQKLSHQGAFAQANRQYQAILDQYPNHLATQISAAYNLSWSGDYKSGIAAFEQIIEAEPEWEDAHVGLGYSLAWDQQYVAAKRVFLALLQRNPQSEEAQKGLAYLSLWTDHYYAARRQFDKLLQAFPSKAEYANALGVANMRLGNHKEARAAFDKALTLDATSKEALLFLSLIPAEPALWELHTWGGYSQVDAQSKLGLRAVHLQLRPSEKLQLWVRYDNSLALDNYSFIQTNAFIPTWFGGGLIGWNKQWATRLEIGRRILPNSESTFLFQGEQIYNFGNNYAAKAGGFYAPNKSGTAEYLIFAGVQVPLSAYHNLEPMYYLSYNANGLPTHRGVLNTEYRSPTGKYRLGGGIMYGRERSLASGETSAPTFGANLLCQTSLLDQHWALLNIRYESGIQSPLFSISAGLRLRFER